jgi:hypothetical protein
MIKRNICCVRTKFEKKLSQLTNVVIVKRGVDSIQNKTLHYIILLNFDDGSHLDMMETNSEKKIKFKVIIILFNNISMFKLNISWGRELS